MGAGLAALLLLALGACKEKKQSNIIIAHKPIVVKKLKPQVTGNTSQTREVSWLGSTYSVNIMLTADPSLPLASDGSQEYYDNRATLRITRSDGTTFVERSFTKSDFKPYVDNAYYKGGALLAIVFDKAEGGSLKFAVTVGNPDKSSDEFVPLEMSVSRLGDVSIDKVTQDQE